MHQGLLQSTHECGYMLATRTHAATNLLADNLS